jgi:hypothetical protein
MLERIEGVLKRARVAGGWQDDAVARDVLAVMREPDAAMINAGYIVFPGETFQRPREPMNAWSSMIDAALAMPPDEPEPG